MSSNANPFLIPGGLDGWIKSTNGLGSTVDAYERVPVIYRAVNLRASALAGIPHGLEDDAKDEPVDWPFECRSADLLWQIEAHLLLRGEAFVLVVRKGGRVVDLKALNPFTVTVNIHGDTLTFSQYINGRRYPAQGEWTEDDIIYIREWSPRYDIHSGQCAASVALGDASLLYSLTGMSEAFFKSGAMPITMITGIGPQTAPAEVKRIEGFFKSVMSGVSNAFRVVAMRGDVKPTVITPPIKDLVIPELSQQARRNVALAFGIPETMLEDAANFATAVEHHQQFYTSTVIPRAEIIAGRLNAGLFERVGYEFEFYPDQLAIFQTEETERAGQISAYVAAGFTTLEAVDILGIDIPENARARLEAQSATPSQPSEPIEAETGTEPEEELDDMETMKAFRRLALSRVGQGIGSKTLDPLLVECKTKSDVRRVFETHWPTSSQPEQPDELKQIIGEIRDVARALSSPPPASQTVNVKVKGGAVSAGEDDAEMLQAKAMEAMVQNLAEQLAAVKTLLAREQPAPQVTVNNEVKASEVVIPAPVVTVAVNPTPVEIVNNVEVVNPDRKVTLQFARDGKGDISKATGTSEAQQ